MKLYIVGPVSSGKSTLANRVSEKTRIPWYPLDEVVHISDPLSPWGNRKRSEKERDKLFQAILQQSDWIVEDVGRACFVQALNCADFIVLLDVSSNARRFRIMKRWIRQRLGIEKCIYRPSIQMLKCMYKWSKGYDLGRDCLKQSLTVYGEKVIVIRKHKELESFIEEFSTRGWVNDKSSIV